MIVTELMDYSLDRVLAVSRRFHSVLYSYNLEKWSGDGKKNAVNFSCNEI